MSFYSRIAEALDEVGIESRVVDGLLLVPIAPELEIQFQHIEVEGGLSTIDAANVFVARTDEDGADGSDVENSELTAAVDDEFETDELDSESDGDVDGGAEEAGIEDEDGVNEERFEAALVSVVFSVEGAVEEVNKHMTTDQLVTVLHDLLEGTDDRISNLEFVQDSRDALAVSAEVGDGSLLHVQLSDGDEGAQALVRFVAFGEDFDILIEQAESELFSEDLDLDDDERYELYQATVADIGELTKEVLELGTFTDFDLLFNALAVAEVQAREWESLLAPLDDGSVDAFDGGFVNGELG
ncbi:hypothetical protein [Corynebacterium sp. HMSC28B08]|uniref:hypothetical protein n=1 Tax=Corynebacterium sp. HMSC28B08 TaxID=1581066 RepID=UPI000A539327|nr:hypothetical protein [Corynebacterium sp. HMSC28B08]